MREAINEGNLLTTVIRHDVLIEKHGNAIEKIEDRHRDIDEVKEKAERGRKNRNRILWSLLVLAATNVILRLIEIIPIPHFKVQ